MGDITSVAAPTRSKKVTIVGWALALIGLYSAWISAAGAYQIWFLPQLVGWGAKLTFSVIGVAVGAAMLYAGLTTIRRVRGWRRWALAFAILFVVAGGLQMAATWRKNPLPYVVVLGIGVFMLHSVRNEPKEA